MSTEPDHAREIAERIARRVANDIPEAPRHVQLKPEVTSELAAVRAGLSELQRKIAQLEAKVSSESGDTQPTAGFQSSERPAPNTLRSIPSESGEVWRRGGRRL